MKLEHVELFHTKMPLVGAFRTSFGTQPARETFLLHVTTDVGEGWAEYGGDTDPLYCSEFSASTELVLRDHLIPRLSGSLTVADVGPKLKPVKGHRMAKHVLETALLDAELRGYGMPLSTFLGSVRGRVAAGVSVGIMDTIPELVEAVRGYLEAGYVRIKLKIQPGWDILPVRAVRHEFGDEVPLQVDANTAYSLTDARHLRQLDQFGLQLIEQPLDTDDLAGHARLAALLDTPICLDESIESARDAAAAIAMGACSVINIKPSRVGGYLEARRIHDVAVAAGIPVWCGGMLESGVGRAANLALAALPGFVLPGDTSASNRYYAEDLTDPFVLHSDGTITLPTGPGIGVTPKPEVLQRFTVARRSLLGL